MMVVTDISQLERALIELRRDKGSLAFVPTMGNLHDGHLSLVRQAAAAASAVVVSIFVNPMQFGANEDLASYPRTLEADLMKLEQAAVDLVFTPTVNDMYPEGTDHHTKIHVPVLGEVLCGASRPGHFDGVSTVVYKLFRLVKPEVAVFGEKDLQQLLIIKKMVADLDLRIDILSGPTQRAADGLALSSRNLYLSDTERALAPTLYATLVACAEALRSAPEAPTAPLQEARSQLVEAGFTLDYLELRDLHSLACVDSLEQDCALFVAARLGTTRLIDNIQIRSA